MKPTYSHEKPHLIVYPSEQILEMEKSGKYIAEIKLNEHRSFIVRDKNWRVFSRHGNELSLSKEHQEQLNTIDLPKGTVLDGGYFNLKSLTAGVPRIYIFDVLEYGTEKFRDTFEKRIETLDKVFPKSSSLIWKPIRTLQIKSSFEGIVRGKSPILTQAAKAYGIPVKDLLPQIEGLVIKNLAGRHSYPVNTRVSANFYKLRVVDLPLDIKKQIRS